ncbi:hypothetical protein [Streptomyces sp. NPDC055056]
MPATLPASHLAPVLPVAKPVTASDLSNAERTVALYASDMPGSYSYQRGGDAQAEAWIVQGALRVGLPELYRSAAFLSSFQALRLVEMATPDQRRAHRVRFPSAARLRRASSLASLSLHTFRVSAEALQRSRRPEVEGTCLCGGTGWVDVYFDPDDPTTFAAENCVGHNPHGHKPRALGVVA